jgi:hypothetical protein
MTMTATNDDDDALKCGDHVNYDGDDDQMLLLFLREPPDDTTMARG